MVLGVLNGAAAIVVIKRAFGKEWTPFIKTYVVSIGIRTGILLILMWLGVKFFNLDGKVFPAALVVAYFLSKIVELTYVSKAYSIRIKNNLKYKV